MPFSAELKEGFVLVRHEGVVTPEEAEASSVEALRLARMNKVSRVIVDLRGVTNEPDPRDLRSVMEGTAEITPPRPHAAIIVREDQHPQFRFIEDFAASRGMPIRVFIDEDEAVNWLAE